jgi:hypothetical protein
MLTSFLRYCCSAFILFSISSLVQADVYKWIDQQGQTHYSQTPPPPGQSSTLIKTARPPSLDAENQQKEIDTLIQQQADAQKQKEQQLQQQRQAAAEAEQKAESCKLARHNLQQYQDNPGRRVMDSQGNVTRPSEEDRQEMIKKMQDAIKEFCQ